MSRAGPGTAGPGAPERAIAGSRIEVRGAASAEEVAAIIAAVTEHNRTSADVTSYERWRRQRLAALAGRHLP